MKQNKEIGLSWWFRWWRIHLQCGRPRFDPWVGEIPWRRERLPTPVFWPGGFRGQRSLVSYSPWGCRVGHDWVTKHTAHPGCAPLVSAQHIFTHLLGGGVPCMAELTGQSHLDWQGLFWRRQSWSNGIHPPPMTAAPDSLGPHVQNVHLICWKYAYTLEP